MNDWPFRDAENTAVLTTLQVLEHGAPILRVSHDADDGCWQFHSEGTPQTKDGRVLSLREIVDLDPSVIELADLPLGWVATRSDAAMRWSRHKKESAFDETAG